MDISLTDFVEFIIKAGTPKMTCVRNLKFRPKYHPSNDYYKGLREAISQFHEGGSSDETILTMASARHSRSHDSSRYPDLLKAYKKFLGRKSVEFMPPPRTEWKFGDLIVRMNPELMLKLNGVPTVIKLYLKDEKLIKLQVDTILYMMQTELSPLVPEGTQIAILDVARAKLIPAPLVINDLSPLLRAEALAFIELWNSLEKK